MPKSIPSDPRNPKLWVDSVPVTGPAPASNTRSAALDGDDAHTSTAAMAILPIAARLTIPRSGHGEVVKTKTRKKHNTITEGSGNVFADMGVPEPEHALAKAKLAAKIAAAIEEEELTQTEAAERLGTDQAKVSAIVRGRLDQFSTERLLQYAQMIGYDVEIRFSRRHQGTGRLRIGT